MSQDYNLAQAFVTALTGDPAAVMDWRAIHDTDNAVAAIPMRGTLADTWSSIVHYNNLGYGIFATVAAMDGQGREIANVQYLRAHYLDLDNLSSLQNYQQACGWNPAPSFAVQSSPGKFHVYWVVTPYTGSERFTLLQRKLRQLFDGDKRVIDAARVMRIPGTLHRKGEPHLVTCWSLAGMGQALDIVVLEAALAHINVIDGGNGVRHDLGDPELAAPSLEWAKRALDLTDPNTLDRGAWIAYSAGWKQAAWTLADPATLFEIWSVWCGRYDTVGPDGKRLVNDPGENLKQWNDIRRTELGWKSLVNRTPSLKASLTFDGIAKPPPPAGAPGTAPPDPSAPPTPSSMPEPRPLDCSGPYLTHLECKEWFKGFRYVLTLNEMLNDDNRFLNVSQFNVDRGGKYFIIDSEGKKTDEAWKAATRSTLWTVPKVDHIRFLPERPWGEIVMDDLGRKGVNTYRPTNPVRLKGDVTPFLRHIAALLPDPTDQRIIIEYLAHNAKYPGDKIPWAPVIQSAEGAGKGVLKLVMSHVMGRPYVHFPNAKQLGDSGSQFNAWMRNKLFILADEIKVDDKRDMIEVLKPMISEKIIEIQSKGYDQALEDNPANWLFFTNWKDAIPINKNGRRFAIFYSVLQSADDMLVRQMGDAYFKALYAWLNGLDGYPNGAAIVADYLLEYPIERGAVPMRAPDTSSMHEALALSRGPLERMIIEAIEDHLPGFRGGWVSSVAVNKQVKATGAISRSPQPSTLASILKDMGYVDCGRAPVMYARESMEIRPTLYHVGGLGNMAEYGPLQGY